MSPKRVHTEGSQFGPCPLCGGTGDKLPSGEYGGGWTGSDYPAFADVLLDLANR